MYKYLYPNISIIENDRSGIELNDISTKLLLDLPLSKTKSILEIFSASGVVAISAALDNPMLHVEEFVTNITDHETIRTNFNNNGIKNGSVFPITRINETDKTADIIIIKTVLEKRKQLIIKMAIMASSHLNEGGVIYLVGAKKEGVQSIAKQISNALEAEQETIAYKQSVHLIKIMPTAKKPAGLVTQPQNYQEIEIKNIKLQLITDETLFAKGGLDSATKLLAENMVIDDNDRVLDLGCGSGILGMAARKFNKNIEVVMVDYDFVSVDLCKQNVELNNLTDCQVLASDGTKAIKDQKFNVVVTNPPFHQGKKTLYAVAEQFIQQGFLSLTSGGKLFVVCNIFLPYEQIVERTFGNKKITAENKSYKVISAIKH